MSAVDGKTNPWQSLAILIENGIPVATLATAIETMGIQTFDRFGRRGPARAGEIGDKYSVTHALDQLANYYADVSYPDFDRENPDALLEKWFDGYSPLYDFGWPNDELPDFDDIQFELPPEKGDKKVNIDEPLGVNHRRSYLKIIALLCDKCGIDFAARGAAAKIAELAQHYVNVSLDEGAVLPIIRLIPEVVSLKRK